MAALREDRGERAAEVLGVRCARIADVLEVRAAAEGGRAVFSYLEDGGAAREVTFAELDRRARAIAAVLGELAGPRRRVLLVFAPGADFPAALFGAFYAGTVAVPAAAPDPARLNRTLPRLRAITADARPAAILTTSDLVPALGDLLGGGRGPADARLVAVDALEPALAESWRRPPDLRAESLAFLQYTSGSTASPKGVMISHAGLLAALRYLERAWGYDRESRALMWVPDFHDDGLVHGNLLPVWAGYRCWRLPPQEVVRRPATWLEAIHAHRITHSGGPNFAFELCIRKAPPAEPSGLDLGSWRVAYNAAEPVRASTLDRFQEVFGPHGFAAGAADPAYGLAEATLLVTTGEPGSGPHTLTVDVAALEESGRVEVRAAGDPRGRRLVGCGRPVLDTRIEIADPATLEPLDEGRVGEILVASRSLADGYWNLPALSEETFLEAFGDPPARFLRTGDLGFLHRGELYVTGRIKDLIIIRGRNLYPQDVEATAEAAHPALRRGCGAAFSVDRDGEERLVVVQEVAADPGPAGGEICRRIVQAVAEEHEVHPWAVALLAPRTVAKTSSGKIQRGACREAFEDGRLEELARWPPAAAEAPAAVESAAPEPAGEPPAAPEPAGGGAEVDELLAWLRGWSERRLDSRLMDERRSLSPHAVVTLGHRGLFGLTADRRHGGLGWSTRDAVRVFRQLGAADLTLASFVLGQNWLGVHPIESAASPDARRRLLPALTAGRRLSAFALTEAGAGSNPRALRATGRWDPASRRWRLEGTKTWIGNAGWAEVVNVFVRLEGGPGGEEGITGFALEAGAGLEPGAEIPTLGLKGMVQGSLHLHGVTAGEADLLGAPGGGLDVVEDALARSRIGLGAVAAGAMMRCAQLAARYAGRREIATGLLADHPVTLGRLAGLTAAVTALECLVDGCARALDAGEGWAVDASMTCKIAGAEMLWRAADGLVQTLGARGYAEPNVAPRILRDARALRIYEGPTEALVAHLGSRAAHRDATLFAWLERRDRRAADELNRAVETAPERFAAPAALDPRQRRLWHHQRLGTLAHWAVLRAAVSEAAARRGSSTELARAASWLEESFAEAARRAAGGTAAERVLLGAGAVGELIDRFEEAVGDLEPRAPVEDWALDPLLRRRPEGSRDFDEASGAAPERIREEPPAEPSPAPAVPAGRSGEIAAWLAGWIATHVEVPAEAVTPEARLSTFLDSVTAVMMMADLEGWLGRSLDPALPWAHPTIETLSRQLAEPA